MESRNMAPILLIVEEDTEVSADLFLPWMSNASAITVFAPLPCARGILQRTLVTLSTCVEVVSRRDTALSQVLETHGYIWSAFPDGDLGRWSREVA
jgi:hypothetical protein